MKRRRFLQLSATIAGITPILKSCNNRKIIPGKIVGASAAIGHILRNGKPQQTPISSIEKQVVIIGGGISGLSAARWLYKSGIKDFVLLDLDKQMGGNAACGTNETSAFSWGAHYITIPNNSLQEYLDFLQECNVINGFNEKGLPIINEYYLCHDPQERLYIHGTWQDGLIPNIGLKDADKQELLAFLALMESYKTIRGNDGKEAFAIPIDNSSNDKTYTILDTITMKEWLLQKNFNSEYVHWYVNYCTKDDFGTNYNIISAWVGIHYFAARKGIAANASSHDVITWPSGNAWLVNELKKKHANTNAKQCISYRNYF
ncbi:MAG: NAD(P)-binding protein [Chitinophagaceae bacterium]